MGVAVGNVGMTPDELRLGPWAIRWVVSDMVYPQICWLIMMFTIVHPFTHGFNIRTLIIIKFINHPPIIYDVLC